MKCVMNGETVKRIADTEAQELVKDGWKYCAKHVWKLFLRTGHISKA